MPPPKFATPRDYSRPTRGIRQGEFARIWLGQPLMPWQQYVADVAGELNPDGLPRYPFIVGTLPRQAGKSHYCMARKGERCFSVPNFRSWYTAQTGGDARDQFLKFKEQTDTQPLGRVVRTLVGNGREAMHFPNGSWLRPHPPGPQSLHGKQSDDNDVDEAWAFTEPEGRELIQAIGPTQLTRPGAQTFIWSAGGTADSTWLAELVSRGRAGDPRICFFEWGIPDAADAEDLDVIAEHHPAYGHTVTRDSLETLRATFGDDAAGWARAAGNRWTEVIGGLMPAATWASLLHTDPIPEGLPLAYAAARAEDGSEVAIAAAAMLPDQTILVEILDVLPTAYLAAEHVKGWAQAGPLIVPSAGPSASLSRDLLKLKTKLLPFTGTDAAAALAGFLDSIKHRGIRFRPHPALDAAILVAGTRRQGDGGRALSHTAAGASIASLEAGIHAAYALTHAPARLGKPRIITAA